MDAGGWAQTSPTATPVKSAPQGPTQIPSFCLLRPAHSSLPVNASNSYNDCNLSFLFHSMLFIATMADTSVRARTMLLNANVFISIAALSMISATRLHCRTFASISNAHHTIASAGANANAYSQLPPAEHVGAAQALNAVLTSSLAAYGVAVEDAHMATTEIGVSHARLADGLFLMSRAITIGAGEPDADIEAGITTLVDAMSSLADTMDLRAQRFTTMQNEVTTLIEHGEELPTKAEDPGVNSSFHGRRLPSLTLVPPDQPLTLFIGHACCLLCMYYGPASQDHLRAFLSYAVSPACIVLPNSVVTYLVSVGQYTIRISFFSYVQCISGVS